MKTTHSHFALLLLLLINVPFDLFSQVDLKVPEEKTKSYNIQRHPFMIIKTDLARLLSASNRIISVGIECPIGKRVSFENTLGYLIDGTYEYGDDRIQTSVFGRSMNFKVSSGLKYYCRQSNSRRSFYLGTNIEYSQATYHGAHKIEHNWVYSSWFLWGGWSAQDSHINEFEVKVKTIGVNFLAGWHFALSKRIPFEIGAGIGFRKTVERVENYEETSYAPSGGYFLGISLPSHHPKHYEPSVVRTQFNFKIGYMIFKNKKDNSETTTKK